MQRLKRLFFRFRRGIELAVLGLGLLASGCLEPAAGPDTTSIVKPLTGTTLKLSCPDERLRKLLEPMARVWSADSGAVVMVSAERMAPEDSADLAILPTAELGAWAERGDLAPVPFNLREPGNAYQWSSVLQAYRSEAYAGWGSQLFGLPVAAETLLIVYRADRFSDPVVQADFKKKHNRPLTAPTTWEAFVDVAAFFADRDKKPSLAAVNATRLEGLFSRVAACYDRPAVSGEGSDVTAGLAFEFDLTSGQSRLETKGFVEAGRWLASLKSRGCLPAEGDPDAAAALNDDRAVMAIATLADLMKLNADHKRTDRYGLAALPGTKSFVNPKTGNLAPVPSNFVPYFNGGWLGVVRRSCKNPEAAFALLAEITGPARNRELIAAGGFAPVRDSQLEPDRLQVWLGYGFDETRTRALQDILRSNVGTSIRNPAYGLRSPDEAELRRELRAELVRIANGEVPSEAGLKAVSAKWNRVTHADWRRRAAGLN